MTETAPLLRIEYHIAESLTRKSQIYTVTAVNGMPVSCTCPSWAFSTVKPYVCKHMALFYKGESS